VYDKEVEIKVQSDKGAESLKAEVVLVAWDASPSPRISVSRRRRWRRPRLREGRRDDAHRRAIVYAIGDIVPTAMLATWRSTRGSSRRRRSQGRTRGRSNYDHVPTPPTAIRGRQRRPDRSGGARPRLQGEGGQVSVPAPRQGADPERAGGVREGWSATSRYDELLGVHASARASPELIAEGVLALTLESTVEEIHHAIHAHPTSPRRWGRRRWSCTAAAFHI